MTDGVSTAARPQTAEIAVAARMVDLRKVYGEGDSTVAALDGVSVVFAAGEFTTVMGPSGSGKSTLMLCMAALDTSSSGQVFLGEMASHPRQRPAPAEGSRSP